MEIESMPPETLRALRRSIAKWERVVAGGVIENRGPADCALCGLFNSTYNKDLTNEPCVGCPVMARTGKRHCKGSPYDELETFECEYNGEDVEEFDARYRALAQRELDFLKSLLPAHSAEAEHDPPK